MQDEFMKFFNRLREDEEAGKMRSTISWWRVNNFKNIEPSKIYWWTTKDRSEIQTPVQASPILSDNLTHQHQLPLCQPTSSHCSSICRTSPAKISTPFPSYPSHRFFRPNFRKCRMLFSSRARRWVRCIKVYARWKRWRARAMRCRLRMWRRRSVGYRCWLRSCSTTTFVLFYGKGLSRCNIGVMVRIDCQYEFNVGPFIHF